jgi:hypothetical protein
MLQAGVDVRFADLPAFRARITPMRATMVGQPRSAALISISIAVCHSAGSAFFGQAGDVGRGVFQRLQFAAVGQGNRIIERAVPVARHQANRSTPACVNFTNVLNSCIVSHPRSIASFRPTLYSAGEALSRNRNVPLIFSI